MEPWRQYQEEAAEFFRSIGLTAHTDQTLRGARSSHDVDVVVRWTQAGLDLLWIIECKRWKRPVTKHEVVALRSIVEDLGADKGIILSESGFQRGALQARELTNIVVTSLAEFRLSAEKDVQASAITELERRVESARQLFDSMWINDGKGSVSRPGFSRQSLGDSPMSWLGQLSLLESAIQQARFGRFPAVYAFEGPAGNEKRLRASNGGELIENVLERLPPLETALARAASAVENQAAGRGTDP